MNADRQPFAAHRLPLALAVAALAAADVQLGLAALFVLVVTCPPSAPWRPWRVVAVLRTYVPWAALWLAGTVGYLHAMHAVGHPVAVQPQLEALAQRGFDHPGAFGRALAIVFVAPLVEELLFRGYLHEAFVFWLPKRAAWLATALLFGLAHGVDYALPITALGLLFGHLRACHGALFPSMLAHALHNGLTVVVAVAWPRALEVMYPR